MVYAFCRSLNYDINKKIKVYLRITNFYKL